MDLYIGIPSKLEKKIPELLTQGEYEISYS